MRQRALWQERNGEARNHSTKDGDSRHSERSGREGNAGGGLEANEVPRIDAVTMEHQVREDRARVATEARQLVDRNRVPRSGSVDIDNLAQGLWLSDLVSLPTRFILRMGILYRNVRTRELGECRSLWYQSFTLRSQQE